MNGAAIFHTLFVGWNSATRHATSRMGDMKLSVGDIVEVATDGQLENGISIPGKITEVKEYKNADNLYVILPFNWNQHVVLREPLKRLPKETYKRI